MAYRKLTDTDIDQIVDLYTTPDPDGTWRSSTVIGKQFGVSKRTVLNYLRRSGIEIRSPAETQKGHTYRPIINVPPEGENPPPCKCSCEELVKWDRSHKRWYKYVKGHYRPRKPYYDKEWLDQEYVIKGRSSIGISREFGVGDGTIRKFLRKHNIPIRTQAESLHLSGAVRGSNNPAWKGGIADWDYSHDWKAIARAIKGRDNWACQLCDEQRDRWGNDLHVHHIDEDKTNDHPHNLISLCAACHHPIHGDEGIRESLQQIARRNTDLVCLRIGRAAPKAVKEQPPNPSHCPCRPSTHPRE